MKKCWKDQLIIKGKFNFRGYSYVVNQIKQFYADNDIPMTYEYLLNIEYEPLTVYGAMKQAQDKLLKTKSKVQEEKVKELKVEGYSDYLGDILKCL